MHLINIHTMALEYFPTNPPPYVILSHRWGAEEVTFQDWKDRAAGRGKAGYAKIEAVCRLAREEGGGIAHAWVDTCCIDKSSSAELSEAINSMFGWYQKARICIVYLDDVAMAADPLDPSQLEAEFEASKWFTRGWTLQELLAPRKVRFYTRGWHRLAYDKRSRILGKATGIHMVYLLDRHCQARAPVATRMSWMTKRVTTRVEDMAYCMLGLLGINMTPMYGEGPNAFVRLQEEIIRTTNDPSLFCWLATTDHPAVSPHPSKMMAPCPSLFGHMRNAEMADADGDRGLSLLSFTVDNAGLAITLPVLFTTVGVLALLPVQTRQNPDCEPEQFAVDLRDAAFGASKVLHFRSERCMVFLDTSEMRGPAATAGPGHNSHSAPLHSSALLARFSLALEKEDSDYGSYVDVLVVPSNIISSAAAHGSAVDWSVEARFCRAADYETFPDSRAVGEMAQEPGLSRWHNLPWPVDLTSSPSPAHPSSLVTAFITGMSEGFPAVRQVPDVSELFDLNSGRVYDYIA